MLVADLMSHVRHADVDLSITKRNIPMFLIGHSLGGTIAIIAARDDPALFKGIALSSPATEPPANMFGVMGRIQRALSGITSILIPKVEIIALPKAPDPKLQAFYDADPLNSSTGVRARVGKEVLNAYKNIGDHAADVKLPFLIVHGENDNLISPQAAPRFHDAASSEDKTIFLGKGRGHNLLSEEGKEEMWELFADWIAHRIK